MKKLLLTTGLLLAGTAFLSGCSLQQKTTKPATDYTKTVEVSPKPTADDVNTLEKDAGDMKLEQESFK